MGSGDIWTANWLVSLRICPEACFNTSHQGAAAESILISLSSKLASTFLLRERYLTVFVDGSTTFVFGLSPGVFSRWGSASGFVPSAVVLRGQRFLQCFGRFFSRRHDESRIIESATKRQPFGVGRFNTVNGILSFQQGGGRFQFTGTVGQIIRIFSEVTSWRSSSFGFMRHSGRMKQSPQNAQRGHEMMCLSDS